MRASTERSRWRPTSPRDLPTGWWARSIRSSGVWGGGLFRHVSLSAALQRFEALEVAIGPALLKGRLEQQLPARGRPSLSLELSGNAFDVEAARALAFLAGADRGEKGLLTDYNVAARINRPKH
jgi:hypothetical protein